MNMIVSNSMTEWRIDNIEFDVSNNTPGVTENYGIIIPDTAEKCTIELTYIELKDGLWWDKSGEYFSFSLIAQNGIFLTDKSGNRIIETKSPPKTPKKKSIFPLLIVAVSVIAITVLISSFVFKYKSPLLFPPATTNLSYTSITPTTKPISSPPTTSSQALTTKTTTAVTTKATTVSTTKVTTTGTTSPITPGSIYVDIDFDYEHDAVIDRKGNVMCTPVGEAMVDIVEVTHNGTTSEKSALVIHDAERKSWVECTFNNLVDAAQLNKFVKEMNGWTVEAFYLNKSFSTAIVGATEGNAKDERGRPYGKQGWGLIDNLGNLYFIFGDGNNAWTRSSINDISGTTEFCHIVAVYDASTQTNTIYLNGVAIESVAAAGFAASEALGKDSTGEKVFNIGNGFFLGADPTVNELNTSDFPASNLTISDIKIYAGALDASEVSKAYNAILSDFIKTSE